MVRKSVLIESPAGLHLRAAAILARAAGRFASDVTILWNGAAFNAKSVISTAAAGIGWGETVQLEAEGPDEEEALLIVGSMLESDLDEERISTSGFTRYL